MLGCRWPLATWFWSAAGPKRGEPRRNLARIDRSESPWAPFQGLALAHPQRPSAWHFDLVISTVSEPYAMDSRYTSWLHIALMSLILLLIVLTALDLPYGNCACKFPLSLRLGSLSILISAPLIRTVAPSHLAPKPSPSAIWSSIIKLNNLPTTPTLSNSFEASKPP